MSKRRWLGAPFNALMRNPSPTQAREPSERLTDAGATHRLPRP